jgi:hypothetical protein
MFEEELNYFIQNQNELVKKYNGTTLVLRSNSVDSFFSTPLEAYEYAKKKYQPGTFMIQPCIPGEDVYKITISSNIIKW